jgi:bifunctional DNase/RNase
VLRTGQVVAASLLAALAIVLTATLATTSDASAPSEENVEVHVMAVVASEDGSLNAILLVPEEGEPILAVFVEQAEALAIVARLREEEDSTPHPTDAVRSAIRSLGGKVERVSIEGVEPLSSQGRIFLVQGDKRMEVPAAGAICIEMAIAEDVPLQVDRKMLERLGITRKEFEEMTPDEEPAEPHPMPSEPGGGRVPL